MSRSQSTTVEYTELEMSAAEGLVKLWRSWQAPMRPTATVTRENQVVSSVRTRPATRKRSRTEAHAVPVPEVSPRPSKMSRSYLSHGQDQPEHAPKVCNNSDVTESLEEVVTKAICEWRAANAGAKSISPATIARTTHEAVLKTTQHIKLLELRAASLAPVNNLQRAPRLPSTASPRPSTRRNKENVRVKREAQEYKQNPCVKVVPIGDGYAHLPAYILNTMDWNQYKAATRSLLEHVFGKRVLATQNLTGKASPAFPNRVPKGQLEPDKVRDIVQTVVKHTGVSESLVRARITSKCADEGKKIL